MKFSKKLNFSILFICIVALLFVSATAYANNSLVQPRTTEENSIMPISTNDETTDTKPTSSSKNLYLTGTSVNVDYPVNGNVFILANNVTISGKIVGNVFVLGQNVSISSKAYINSTLFACAENLDISGVVFDVFSLANSTSINSGARILRDATMGGSSLDLSGTISRNADLGFNTINVTPNSAKIGGDLSYSSNSESISKDIVEGELSFTQVTTGAKFANTAMNFLTNFLEVLVVSAIIILVITFAMPKFADKEQQILENKTLISIGYGAITLIAIPVVCFILFCTVIGIIPALSILFAYIFVISQMVIALVSIPLARIICKKMNKNTKGMNILASILLVAVIWLLQQIPVLGGFVSLFVILLGLGILTYSVFHSKVENKKKTVVAKASTVVEKSKD